MALRFAVQESLIGRYFNPETMEFQDTPIEIEVPTLPEKLTQEELRYMKIITDATLEWRSVRGLQQSLTDLSSSQAFSMARSYEKIKEAQKVASLFVPKRRIEELTTYAKKNPRAVLYICDQKRVK